MKNSDRSQEKKLPITNCNYQYQRGNKHCLGECIYHLAARTYTVNQLPAGVFLLCYQVITNCNYQLPIASAEYQYQYHYHYSRQK